MLVRVSTQDVESAKGLVVYLVGLFGGEHVSLHAEGEVQLQVRAGAKGALVAPLEAIERWLEQTRTASAEVCVDERSYTVEHPEREPRSTAFSSGSSSPRARVVFNGWKDSRKAAVRR